MPTCPDHGCTPPNAAAGLDSWKTIGGVQAVALEDAVHEAANTCHLCLTGMTDDSILS